MKGAIKQFALKNPDFVYGKSKPVPNLADQNRQAGGFIVPGTGSGDTFKTALTPGWFIMNREATSAYGFNRGGKVPVALEPGERAIPPQEVRAMGGAGTLEAMNRSVPRFQKGGEIGKPQLSGPAGPLLEGGQAAIDKVHKAAEEYVSKHRPKAPAGGGGAGAAFAGPPPGMKQLGDNAWVDSHTYTVANYLASKFGSEISSDWRSAAENAAANGSPTSSHMRGTAANPGAFDFVPPKTSMQRWVSEHVAGITENDIHDYGSGLHNHIAFFKLGGLIQALAKGGSVEDIVRVITGKVSYFDGPSSTTASGTPVSSPGLALNLNPGTDSGWNNSTTQGWMDAARSGNPVFARTTITGKTANLPIIDLGPSGFTGRAIDVTAAGARKLGLSTSSFPTDSIGKAAILGKGGGELTEGMKKQAEGKARKANYEAKLRQLRQRVGDSKTAPAKQSALWKLIHMWGRVGIFGKGERAHILERVQAAAAKGKPEGTVKILSNLAAYARKAGDITGQDPDDYRSMTDAIEKAQERGRKERERAVKRHSAARQRKIARIAARGNFPGLAKMLEQQEGAYNIANQGAEKLVALEPEDLTDDYVGRERGAWGSVLEQLGGWRDKSVGARDFAEHRKLQWEADIDGIRAFHVPGDKFFMRYFRKHKWRIPPLREAIANANTFLEDRRGELGDLQGFGGPKGKIGSVGEGTPWWLTLGGPGSRIFDTQNTIRELALKVGQTGGNEESESDRERADLLEKLLREKNLADAVSGRQGAVMKQWDQMRQGFGFAGMFARGGTIPAGMWGIAGERGPEPVAGPATVFSNDKGREMFGGGGDVEVSLTIKGDVIPAEGVDPSEVAEILVRNPRTREVLRKAVLGGQGVGVRTPGDRGRIR